MDEEMQQLLEERKKAQMKHIARTWSEKDLETLRELYPKMTLVDLHNGPLKHKAISTIAETAKRLGIPRHQPLGGHNQPCWSPDEEQILKDNYRKIPMDELMKLLPGRSELAIETRAQRRGLKRKANMAKVS